MSLTDTNEEIDRADTEYATQTEAGTDDYSENGTPQNGPIKFDEIPSLEHVRWDTHSIEETVNLLLNFISQIGASDLFLHCEEDSVEVTARYVGMITHVASLPADIGHRCISHIRVMAGMKHAEHRQPQDGRWIFRLAGSTPIDLRLNTIPSLHGESIAIRLLPRDSSLRNLDSLGFVGPQLNMLEGILRSPSGMVVITGPTGSGKTTTMYAFLHALHNGQRKIHTIEDPVEYSVQGLYQSQVNETQGPKFPELLRAVIRQGPDVIMIGEVRDRETAETAVRAATSGQLVFASVHAETAAKAIQSLWELGVSPYFLSTSLLAVIGQRLIRTLDPATRVAIDLSNAPRTFEQVERWLSPDSGNVIYAAKDNGKGTGGYVGRTGLLELLLINPTLQTMIRENRSVREIEAKAVEEGMLDFRRAALLHVASGTTSFDEIYRVLLVDDDDAA